MMNRFDVIAGCLLLFVSSGASAQVPHVLGAWELDKEASELPDQFRAALASERRSYTLREDGYLVVLAVRVFSNGNPEFIQIAAKSDGQDYPQYQSAQLADLMINDTPTPFTYSETIVDEHTAEAVGKLNGRLVNRATRTISEDGKRMRLEVTAYQPDGQEIEFALVFDQVVE